ncbi:TrmH family RNA methyltransferase [Chelativorans sp. YIM 93263]|uniref:TrmH family RNA methyltransferase n=1 Tax=Chelativorans sp. YIM 93263 TaxID=2906648 RepID=UPI0023791F5F|nr:RNA methyltransferase [Chelativorans sp. YIM 93263]
MSEAGREKRAPGRVKAVTSLSNPIIKDIRALWLKKHRDRDRAFIAEGAEAIRQALDAGWTIRTLLCATAERDAVMEKIAARTIAAGGLVLEVGNKILSTVAHRENPQGLVGVFEQRYQPLDSIRPARGDVWLALDRVRDPGNLGTIIRTVDAVGAKGIILVGACVDPFSVEAVRATMGSLFSIPIARAEESAFLSWRRSFSGLTVGTHMEGAEDFRVPDYAAQPVLLLMGNEKHGLSEPLSHNCDRLVRIPQAGKAESLNLAVAAGIMLYEARRAVFPTEVDRAS